jgi:hypothetical protein
MGLFERLKGMFQSEQLPEEDRQAFVAAQDMPSLISQIQESITRNEVARKLTMTELSRLEQTEQATIQALKSNQISGRGVKLALQDVKRYRERIETLMRRAEILNGNLNLNNNLLNKIDEMQTMQMQGVHPEQIDRVMIEFKENMERYRETVVGADAVFEGDDALVSENERQQMEALEKEILGESKVYAKVEPEAKQAEPKKLDSKQRDDRTSVRLRLAPTAETSFVDRKTMRRITDQPVKAAEAQAKPGAQAESVTPESDALTPEEEAELEAMLSQAETDRKFLERESESLKREHGIEGEGETRK